MDALGLVRDFLRDQAGPEQTLENVEINDGNGALFRRLHALASRGAGDLNERRRSAWWRSVIKSRRYSHPLYSSSALWGADGGGVHRVHTWAWDGPCWGGRTSERGA